MPYQKAVTEGKSLVVAMTHSDTAANANWKNRNTRPPRVPGMPWMSFIRALGAPLAASVSGGASIGCTAGWLTFIVSEEKKMLYRHCAHGFLRSAQLNQFLTIKIGDCIDFYNSKPY